MTNIGEPRPSELSPDCGRYQDVVTRRLSEEPVTKDEETFARHHLEGCTHCRALAAAVQKIAEPPAISLQQVVTIRAQAMAELRRQRRTFWARTAWVASAAAVVLAVGGVGVLRRLPDTEPVARLQAGSLSRPGASGIAVGDALAVGTPVVAGDSGAVVAVGDSLRTHVARRSSLRLLHARPRDVAIELDAGGLAAVYKPHEPSTLVIQTPVCRVHVVGTIFAVVVRGDDARIDVLEGVVEVEAPTLDKGTVRVAAGSYLHLVGGRLGTLSSQREGEIRALIDGSSATLDFPLEPIVRTEVVSAVPQAPRPPRKVSPTQRPTKARSKAPAAWAPTSTPPTERPPEVDALLLRARDCRERGDWRCGIGAYEELLRRYPQRPEAATVLVPLAEMELEHARAAERALQHFEQYARLQPDGPLAPEALVGVAKALRELNRPVQEQATLHELLRRYPMSAHASQARDRLRELGAPIQ